MPIVLRDLRESDRAYVAKTLARELQKTSVGRAADWTALSGEVDRALSAWLSEGARALVAVDSADEDTIVGYAVGKAPTLHHVYVRGGEHGVRKQGIARQMLEALGECFYYTLPPSQRTTLTRRMSYTPRLTAGYVS